MGFVEFLILQIMGFEKQSRIGSFTTDHKLGYNLIVFNENKLETALLPPLIKRITSMWVYTDIIEISVVGDN